MRRYLCAIVFAVLFIGCVAAAPAPVLPGSALSTTAPTPLAGTHGSPSADNSALLVTRHFPHGDLRRVDVTTGKPVPGLPSINLGMYAVRAFSADGRRLALYVYPDEFAQEAGSLHVADTRTLEDTPVHDATLPNSVSRMAFSPDGRRLAIVYDGALAHGMPINYGLALVDLDRGTIAARATFDFYPRALAFAADGRSIVAYGTSALYDLRTGLTLAPPQAVLLDAQTLETRWVVRFDGVKDGRYQRENPAPGEDWPDVTWRPAAVFSADGTKLYLVHADVQKLTTIDFTRRTVATLDIAPPRTLLDRLMGLGAAVAHAKMLEGTIRSAALSADGSMLFVAGEKSHLVANASGHYDLTTTGLMLEVVDVASGALLKTVSELATEVAVWADGRWIFLYDNGSTVILDAVTFEPVAHFDNKRVVPFRLADGRMVLLAS